MSVLVSGRLSMCSTSSVCSGMSMSSPSSPAGDASVKNGGSSSGYSSSSSSGGSSKYLMKTLCFNKKSQCMPNKETYALLLSCGLGARKWQVSPDLDADTFRLALLSIYPRLASTSSYSLWTLTREKAFERLPQRVNTPARIKAYLGDQFTGCLIIMPAEELSLTPLAKKPTVAPHNATAEVPSSAQKDPTKSIKVPTHSLAANINSTQTGHTVTVASLQHQHSDSGLTPHRGECNLQLPHSLLPHDSMSTPHKRIIPPQPQPLSVANGELSTPMPMRQLCLVCGRMAKQSTTPVGAATFYSIGSRLLPAEGSSPHAPVLTIGQRLGQILSTDLPKKKLVPSEEICKKCFRQLNEIDFLEMQLKNAKDEMMDNFYGTISKIGRIDPAVLQVQSQQHQQPAQQVRPAALPPPPPPPPTPIANTSTTFSTRRGSLGSVVMSPYQRIKEGHHHHQHHHDHQRGFPSFFPSIEIGLPHRVFFSDAYKTAYSALSLEAVNGSPHQTDFPSPVGSRSSEEQEDEDDKQVKKEMGEEDGEDAKDGDKAVQDEPYNLSKSSYSSSPISGCSTCSSDNKAEQESKQEQEKKHSQTSQPPPPLKKRRREVEDPSEAGNASINDTEDSAKPKKRHKSNQEAGINNDSGLGQYSSTDDE